MNVAPLLEYLRTLEKRGQTHIYIDQNSRESLRELYKRAKNSESPKALPTQPVKMATPKVIETPTFAVAAPQVLVKTEVVLPAGSAAAKIAALKAQAEQWPPARQLKTLRETMVFSVGNPEAEIMFVGEAPGYEEERRREPFVGPAGEKLTAMLKAMGLQRSDVYISNIVKFRPAAQSQQMTPTSNRAPSDIEMQSCMPLLREEIAIVKPKVIVALGATAGNGLLENKKAVGALRGSFHEFEGIPVRVTYHPSYILRTEGSPDAIKAKRAVWEDLLAVMELTNLAISEKQRGYFAK